MFQKGKPRPSNAGRKKGSKNKKKVPRISDFLAQEGINPVDEVLRLLPELEPRDQAKLWMDIVSYCQPKPRAIDFDPDDFNLEEFDAIETSDLLKLVKPQIEGK